MDAYILVEQAKREAAEVLQRYERELFLAGQYAEFLQLGIVRHLLTAPVDFLERVDALKAACPEIDRARAQEALRAKLAAWRQHLDSIENAAEDTSR